jgi:peptide/nickel transport system substrate-binding protein
MEVSDDRLTWTFTLREGVTFHDGSPFTAADAVFTFDRIPEVPNSPAPFTQRLAAIESAEAVDDLTRWSSAPQTPAPNLLTDLSTIYIVSQTVGDAESADFDRGTAAHRHRPLPAGQLQPRRASGGRAQRRLLGRGARLRSR